MKLAKVISLIIKDRVYVGATLIMRRRSINIPKWIKAKSAKRMLQKTKIFEINKAVKPLFIETPDGMNQLVHPDVIRTEEGRYLMVVSPYPFGYEVFENPVFYESDNFEKWEYISGPIDFPEVSKGGRRHFSDPVIAKEGEYICFYRECRYDIDVPVTTIYLQKSNNLKSWGNKKIVFSSPMSECDVISPSIYFDDIGMHFYCCAMIQNEMKLIKVDGYDIARDKFIEMNLKGIPKQKILWHMSVIPHNKGELFLIVLADCFGGANSELYIAVHRDYEDDTVRIVKKIRIKEIVDNITIEYRATGVVEENTLKIIASVMYDDKTWGCVYLEEKNVENLFEQ